MRRAVGGCLRADPRLVDHPGDPAAQAGEVGRAHHIDGLIELDRDLPAHAAAQLAELNQTAFKGLAEIAAGYGGADAERQAASGQARSIGVKFFRVNGAGFGRSRPVCIPGVRERQG